MLVPSEDGCPLKPGTHGQNAFSQNGALSPNLLIFKTPFLHQRATEGRRGDASKLGPRNSHRADYTAVVFSDSHAQISVLVENSSSLSILWKTHLLCEGF